MRTPLLDDALVDVLDAVPDAVLVVEIDGHIVYANRSVETLFGHRPEALIGEPVESLIPRELGARHRQLRARYAAQPSVRPMSPASDVLMARRADGTTVPVAVSLGPLQWRDKQVVVATVRDADPMRDRLDATLRLRLAAQVAGLGFFDADAVNDTVVWSPELFAVFDVPPDTPVYTGSIRALALPEDVALLKRLDDEVRGPGAQPVYRFEFRIRRRDGEIRWLSATGRTFFGDVDGRRRAVRIIGVVQDVTERKQHELERDARERERHDLLAALAHSLRNPLAAMRGVMDLLEHGAPVPDADARRYAALSTQVDQMTDLVDRLLDVTSAAADGRDVTDARRAPRRRVLVVDDVVDVADVLAELLAAQGHDVRTAYSGTAAIGAIAEFTPDVVLLDLGMPGLDGYATAKVMREAFGEAVALVAVSGWGTDDDRRRTAEAGFDRHLVKPVTGANLATLMAHLTTVGR